MERSFAIYAGVAAAFNVVFVREVRGLNLLNH
jgi:hypothetical protein